ncbi:hypothetical protein FRC12_008207 [Ceratobasidium sp. 428]|nr:hypothetical protein FRC12_008207 [Ceratobasidium sp. 428]
MLPEGSNVFDVSKGSIPAPALALEFPKLGPDMTVTAARFRAHSSGASTSTQKLIPSSLGQTLCLTIRTLRLIHFPAPRANYVIFLDLRRILHHLPQDLSQAQANSLPWSAWGEAATRWNRISDHEPAYPLSKTHGSRYVMARRVEDDGPFTELVVADFNPVRARRSKMYDTDQKRLYLPEENCDATTSGEWPYLKSNPGTKIVVDYVDESRPTVTDGVSDNPIVSRLPYRVTVVSGPAVAFDDWMIDGNRLIGIKVCLFF